MVVHPDEYVQLHSRVLPALPTMDEWLAFLRKADPFTDEEIKEALDKMY